MPEIMEACHECLRLSMYLNGAIVRCIEHMDLPEGCLGAVSINPQIAKQGQS